jgi:glycosyltransferase involved in cell wall biosynthesis
VHFLGKISGDHLYEYTPSADIGLCLLENMGLNYYFSLPNRIFDYLQAGVPVLASRFPEIVNIVEKYNTGRLIDHFESTYLAGVIKTMLDNPLNTEHFDSVAKELCWENEEKGLISVINEL